MVSAVPWGGSLGGISGQGLTRQQSWRAQFCSIQQDNPLQELPLRHSSMLMPRLMPTAVDANSPVNRITSTDCRPYLRPSALLSGTTRHACLMSTAFTTSWMTYARGPEVAAFAVPGRQNWKSYGRGRFVGVPCFCLLRHPITFSSCVIY